MYKLAVSGEGIDHDNTPAAVVSYYELPVDNRALVTWVMNYALEFFSGKAHNLTPAKFFQGVLICYRT